jgi:hypothetical protein
MGYSVVLGDLNGDSWGDVVLGSPKGSNLTLDHNGRVRVQFGSDSLFGNIQFLEAEADLEIWGHVPYGQLGTSLAIGDVNGDKNEDLIIGLPVPLVVQPEEPGSVVVILGTSNLPKTLDLTVDSPDIMATGRSKGDWFGHAVACGDVNGDGYDDIIVGAPKAGKSGEVHIIFGKNDMSVFDHALRHQPDKSYLFPVYPNPFNTTTRITMQFSPDAINGECQLLIMDIKGRACRNWNLMIKTSGYETIQWDGTDKKGVILPSGVYVIQLLTSLGAQSRKVTFLR